MRQKKKQTTNNKPQKQILASAQIKGDGKDTDILNEDLFNEAIIDKNGRSAQLVKNRWVLMFDKKQSFLKSLLALVLNSTTLGNVLKAKTAFTMGEGFQVVEAETTPILKSLRKLVRAFTGAPEQLKDLNTNLLKVNPHGETLEEVIKKVIYDFVAFGNGFAEMVKTTESGREVVYLYHIPLLNVGLEKQNNRGISEKVALCQDWAKDGDKEENLSIIPIYPNFTTGAVKRSVIHIKEYAAGFDYFGLPEWIAARIWAEIEYRIPKYNKTKFKNGFVPSAFAQFFGAMTPEEAHEIIQGIDATFTDTGNNSKIFAQVLRDDSYKMNLEVLEDKSEGKFLELNQLASQGLVTGNRWTMSLSGFATAGKLGTNQQIRDEIEYVTNTVIKPIRRTLLQRVVNPYIEELSKANGDKFKGLKLDIANMTPVSIASTLDANAVLLTNEKRDLLGFDKLDEEGEEKLNQEQNNA